MADAGRAARRSLERVNFNFTAKCNMACRFCYVPFDGEEGSEVEAFAVVDELLARDVKSITFAGGDPLMYPYLQTLISRVKDTTQRCSCNWIRMLYNFQHPDLPAFTVWSISTASPWMPYRVYTVDPHRRDRYLELGNMLRDATILDRWDQHLDAQRNRHRYEQRQTSP